MGIPVTIVESGGVPVTISEWGLPATAVEGRGFPITIVPSGGWPLNVKNYEPPVAQPGTLSVANAFANEGEPVVFTVSRTGGNAGAVSATWTIDFVTADAADLAAGQALTGTVSFADGETSKTVSIATNEDTDFENDETFTFTLSAPTGGATIGTAQATGTIANDDAQPPVEQFDDPDLNSAAAFQTYTTSFDAGGDPAAELFAAFPSIQSYIGVPTEPADLGTLTDATTHPNWNASSGYIRPPSSGGTYENLYVGGYFFLGSDITQPVTIRNTQIKTDVFSGSRRSYGVQRSGTTTFPINVEYSIIETYKSSAVTSGGPYTLDRVYVNDGDNDAFKMGDGGPMRIENSWAQNLAVGAGSHADGNQASSGTDGRMVNMCLYSLADDSPYSTGGLGGYNAAFYPHATAGSKVTQEMYHLGGMLAWGGFYAWNIFAQNTDSIVRNILVAFVTVAPSSMRGPTYGGAGDGSYVHPSLTDIQTEGGLSENIVFFGNKVFGYGPLEFQGANADGIYHWNKAALVPSFATVLRDLGILDANNDPTGLIPVKSIAGVIGEQSVSVPPTGDVALNLDFASIPEGATNITLHVPSGSPLVLEYTA